LVFFPFFILVFFFSYSISQVCLGTSSTSAYKVAGITDVRHHARLQFYFFKWEFLSMLPRLSAKWPSCQPFIGSWDLRYTTFYPLYSSYLKINSLMFAERPR
jgi:hypothetical protein